jgi:Baseplate J-like protein
VTPREESIGPVALRISASTAIDAPDVEAGLVPARVVDVPVEATDTFPATGKRIEEASATGSVRFVNLDPTSKNTIDRGAIVSTGSGARFRLEKKVTVAAAELVFDPAAGKFTIQPATETVDVTAVDAGPEGNVEANTITTIPRGEEPLFLKVSNPDATRGGARDEFPRVKQEDVDSALAALGATLAQQFSARLEDPALVTGEATVFPATAKLGAPTPTVDPDTLVGQEVASFELGATATGTVTSVDAAPVRVIAEARLAAEVDPDHRLIDGSSSIMESPAVVEGDRITYPVVATARQVAILDPGDLKSQVLGRSLAEARDILGAYGTVELTVWPDWVTTIPTFDARVEVQVREPVTLETPDALPSEAAP